MQPNYHHFRAVDDDGSAQEWLVDDYEKLDEQILLYRRNILVQVVDLEDWAYVERNDWEDIH